MPFIVAVNTIAECLRADCNILGDNKEKEVKNRGYDGLKLQLELAKGKLHKELRWLKLLEVTASCSLCDICLCIQSQEFH
jgi:hypothetical protein